MKRNYFIYCLFALLSSLNVLAFDFEVDGIYYTITGSGTVSVVKGTYDYDGDVTIPKTVSNGVETFNVTGIGESAFKSCGELVSVTMPEGLTSIGNEAFYQSSIKTVSLPSTLNSMGTSAFRECRNLTGVVLPDALKDVKEYAFYECSSLKTITLGNQTVNIENYAFYRTAIMSLTIPKTVKTIGINSFGECAQLKSLVINNAALAIGQYAFFRCSSLEDVDLGNSVYDLGTIITAYGCNGVFYECTNLKSISIPSSLDKIGHHAFYNCNKLYDVNLPNMLTEIGAYAFYNCAITEIGLPNTLTTIGEYAFCRCPLKSIDFPSSLKTICHRSFEETALTEVVIPTSVTDIEAHAFNSCTSLKKVKIENAPVTMTASFTGCSSLSDVDLGNAVVEMKSSSTYQCAGCFVNCTSLSSICLPNTIKRIERETFSGCTSLEHVTLPNKLSSIADNTFYNCSSLKTIILPNTLQSIGAYVFANCGQLNNIELPTTLTTIGSYAFSGCNSLTSILIPESLTNLGSGAFEKCSNLESVIFDNSVVGIQNSCFQNCTNLKNVELGKVTSIVDAFKNCIKLESIIIPNSVESLSGSFYGCTSLKKVVIGTGLKKMDNYYGGCFQDCSKLINVEIKSKVLTSVGEGTFLNCRSLKKIEFPVSVTSIGQRVFEGCNVLSNIYMNPTTPPGISDNTFSDYNTPTLHVPAEAKTAYTKADNWKNFTNIIAIGSEPKATAEEIAALDALLTEAQALYNGSVEGTEPGNYRPGAKAAFKAIIDDVQARFSNNMLAEDAEDCTELLNTAIKSFKNKQVKNEIQTNNTLAFAETLKAATGSEFRLPIEMNNTDAITGVQFDLYLPEGMNLSQDEYGDYNIELSERTTARRHSVASRVMPDGALRVVVSSQQNATFEGNSGTLLTLVLFPASTLEAGDYDVELKNVVLTDPDAKRYAAADMKSIITVSAYTMGDVNNDGYIDVADLAGVVRFILENADASLVFNAADMDGNGVVEINDYAALVNVILSQNSPSNTRMFRANAIRNAVITLSTLCLNKDGNGELSVCLPVNDLHYTGLQFDLTLPEGIELLDEGAETTDARHGAWMQKRVDGTYRVICSSMMNDEFCEGEVLRLQVKVTGEVSCESEVVASDVVLSDVNAIRHEAAPAMTILNMDDATGIQDVGSKMEDGSSTIYNLAGQRIQKMQKGLYIVNGKKLFLNK